MIAALAYGTSPIIVRQALQDVGLMGVLVGGSIADAAATILQVSSENARWFIYSGVFVAAAHGHEIFGLVVIGSVGACAMAIDTPLILNALRRPSALATMSSMTSARPPPPGWSVGCRAKANNP